MAYNPGVWALAVFALGAAAYGCTSLPESTRTATVHDIKVEEKLHELAGVTEQTFVVTGVPDGKKGERLVVLHTLPEEKLKECIEKLSQSDLPNLWVPRANQFFRVEKLPYLGTGKLDLRRVRDIAIQYSGND